MQSAPHRRRFTKKRKKSVAGESENKSRTPSHTQPVEGGCTRASEKPQNGFARDDSSGLRKRHARSSASRSPSHPQRSRQHSQKKRMPSQACKPSAGRGNSTAAGQRKKGQGQSPGRSPSMATHPSSASPPTPQPKRKLEKKRQSSAAPQPAACRSPIPPSSHSARISPALPSHGLPRSGSHENVTSRKVVQGAEPHRSGSFSTSAADSSPAGAGARLTSAHEQQRTSSSSASRSKLLSSPPKALLSLVTGEVALDDEPQRLLSSGAVRRASFPHSRSSLDGVVSANSQPGTAVAPLRRHSLISVADGGHVAERDRSLQRGQSPSTTVTEREAIQQHASSPCNVGTPCSSPSRPTLLHTVPGAQGEGAATAAPHRRAPRSGGAAAPSLSSPSLPRPDSLSFPGNVLDHGHPNTGPLDTCARSPAPPSPAGSLLTPPRLSLSNSTQPSPAAARPSSRLLFRHHAVDGTSPLSSAPTGNNVPDTPNDADTTPVPTASSASTSPAKEVTEERESATRKPRHHSRHDGTRNGQGKPPLSSAKTICSSLRRLDLPTSIPERYGGGWGEDLHRTRHSLMRRRQAAGRTDSSDGATGRESNRLPLDAMDQEVLRNPSNATLRGLSSWDSALPSSCRSPVTSVIGSRGSGSLTAVAPSGRLTGGCTGALPLMREPDVHSDRRSCSSRGVGNATGEGETWWTASGPSPSDMPAAYSAAQMSHHTSAPSSRLGHSILVAVSGEPQPSAHLPLLPNAVNVFIQDILALDQCSQLSTDEDTESMEDFRTETTLIGSSPGGRSLQDPAKQPQPDIEQPLPLNVSGLKTTAAAASSLQLENEKKNDVVSGKTSGESSFVIAISTEDVRDDPIADPFNANRHMMAHRSSEVTHTAAMHHGGVSHPSIQKHLPDKDLLAACKGGSLHSVTDPEVLSPTKSTSHFRDEVKEVATARTTTGGEVSPVKRAGRSPSRTALPLVTASPVRQGKGSGAVSPSPTRPAVPLRSKQDSREPVGSEESPGSRRPSLKPSGSSAPSVTLSASTTSVRLEDDTQVSRQSQPNESGSAADRSMEVCTHSKDSCMRVGKEHPSSLQRTALSQYSDLESVGIAPCEVTEESKRLSGDFTAPVDSLATHPTLGALDVRHKNDFSPLRGEGNTRISLGRPATTAEAEIQTLEPHSGKWKVQRPSSKETLNPPGNPSLSPDSSGTVTGTTLAKEATTREASHARSEVVETPAAPRSEPSRQAVWVSQSYHQDSLEPATAARSGPSERKSNDAEPKTLSEEKQSVPESGHDLGREECTKPSSHAAKRGTETQTAQRKKDADAPSTPNLTSETDPFVVPPEDVDVGSLHKHASNRAASANTRAQQRREFDDMAERGSLTARPSTTEEIPPAVAVETERSASRTGCARQQTNATRPSSQPRSPGEPLDQDGGMQDGFGSRKGDVLVMSQPHPPEEDTSQGGTLRSRTGDTKHAAVPREKVVREDSDRELRHPSRNVATGERDASRVSTGDEACGGEDTSGSAKQDTTDPRRKLSAMPVMSLPYESAESDPSSVSSSPRKQQEIQMEMDEEWNPARRWMMVESGFGAVERLDHGERLVLLDEEAQHLSVYPARQTDSGRVSVLLLNSDSTCSSCEERDWWRTRGESDGSMSPRSQRSVNPVHESEPFSDQEPRRSSRASPPHLPLRLSLNSYPQASAEHPFSSPQPAAAASAGGASSHKQPLPLMLSDRQKHHRTLPSSRTSSRLSGRRRQFQAGRTTDNRKTGGAGVQVKVLQPSSAPAMGPSRPRLDTEGRQGRLSGEAVAAWAYNMVPLQEGSRCASRVGKELLRERQIGSQDGQRLLLKAPVWIADPDESSEDDDSSDVVVEESCPFPQATQHTRKENINVAPESTSSCTSTDGVEQLPLQSVTRAPSPQPRNAFIAANGGGAVAGGGVLPVGSACP